MNPVPAFRSVADAMAAVQAGLRFVADADATTMSKIIHSHSPPVCPG
jgi:hypothetical protein